jgi:hypothetical protein
MTIGEDRVRTKFNPSEKPLVTTLKQKSAELIDICQEAKITGSMSDEHQRLWALAQTHYEDAAMWAVKAATF